MKGRSSYARLAFGLLLVATFLAAKNKETHMASHAKAELLLDAPSAKFQPGDEIKLHLSLRNAGAHPLWLNKRMLVNNASSIVTFRELWFDVIGPDAQPLPFIAKVRAGEAESGDYTGIKAGEAHSFDVVLSRYFQFTTPGVYTVTAHYQDGTTQPPHPPDATELVCQVLRSAPIRLKVQASH